LTCGLAVEATTSLFKDTGRLNMIREILGYAGLDTGLDLEFRSLSRLRDLDFRHRVHSDELHSVMSGVTLLAHHIFRPRLALNDQFFESGHAPDASVTYPGLARTAMQTAATQPWHDRVKRIDRMTPDRVEMVGPMNRLDESARLLTELQVVRDQLATAERRIAKLEEVRDRSRRVIRRLATMATTDVLTKLGNRRRFESVLADFFAESIRRGWPLSVVMVDVDVFKSYNDAFGHLAGDQVLCTIAQQLVTSSRPSDIVTRYGGEEFAIVLPDADVTAALSHAERQRAAIESFNWPLRSVTASFGVATRNPPIEDIAELVDGADRALYASKNCGRNRVTHRSMIDENQLLSCAVQLSCCGTCLSCANSCSCKLLHRSASSDPAHRIPRSC
jgi:diguanylate cyclase (GGDEF)-like protein